MVTDDADCDDPAAGGCDDGYCVDDDGFCDEDLDCCPYDADCDEPW